MNPESPTARAQRATPSLLTSRCRSFVTRSSTARDVDCMPSPRRLFMTKVQATREQRFPLSGRFVRRSTNKTLALAISRLKSSVRSTLSRSAAHLSAELPSGGVPADGWPAWREAHWASVAPGAVVQVGSGGDRRYTFGSRGDVAQLGEHCVRIAGVRGSSPLISTIPSASEPPAARSAPHRWTVRPARRR